MTPIDSGSWSLIQPLALIVEPTGISSIFDSCAASSQAEEWTTPCPQIITGRRAAASIFAASMMSAAAALFRHPGKAA